MSETPDREQDDESLSLHDLPAPLDSVIRGPRGREGDPGRPGHPGRTGRAGRSGPDPTRKLAILFAFLAIIATTYGVVLQQAVNRINENAVILREAVDLIEENAATGELEDAVIRYESCLNSVVILTQYNDLLDSLIEAEGDALGLGSEALAAVRADRVDAYEAGMIVLPDCESLNPATPTG